MLRSPAVDRSPSDQRGKKARRLSLFFLILSQFPPAFQADFSQRFPSPRSGRTPILIPSFWCQVASETYYLKSVQSQSLAGDEWSMRRSMVDINLASSASVQSVRQFVTWWGAGCSLGQDFPQMLWEGNGSFLLIKNHVKLLTPLEMREVFL